MSQKSCLEQTLHRPDIVADAMLHSVSRHTMDFSIHTQNTTNINYWWRNDKKCTQLHWEHSAYRAGCPAVRKLRCMWARTLEETDSPAAIQNNIIQLHNSNNSKLLLQELSRPLMSSKATWTILSSNLSTVPASSVQCPVPWSQYFPGILLGHGKTLIATKRSCSCCCCCYQFLKTC